MKYTLFGKSYKHIVFWLNWPKVLICYFFGGVGGVGWGGVVGEVGNKANTAQVSVGVEVGAELGKINI